MTGLFLLFTGLGLFSASGASVPPVRTALAKSASSASNSSTPVSALLTEDFLRSLRDPFQTPASILAKAKKPDSDLEVTALKDIKLNGVITGPKKTKAMVTVPGGKAFFVKVGERMGIHDGRVTSILPELIRVVEYDTDEFGKRTSETFELRMDGELVSKSRKKEE